MDPNLIALLAQQQQSNADRLTMGPKDTKKSQIIADHIIGMLREMPLTQLLADVIASFPIEVMSYNVKLYLSKADLSSFESAKVDLMSNFPLDLTPLEQDFDIQDQIALYEDLKTWYNIVKNISS